jgi:hypothetical protein
VTSGKWNYFTQVALLQCFHFLHFSKSLHKFIFVSTKISLIFFSHSISFFFAPINSDVSIPGRDSWVNHLLSVPHSWETRRWNVREDNLMLIKSLVLSKTVIPCFLSHYLQLVFLIYTILNYRKLMETFQVFLWMQDCRFFQLMFDTFACPTTTAVWPYVTTL